MRSMLPRRRAATAPLHYQASARFLASALGLASAFGLACAPATAQHGGAERRPRPEVPADTPKSETLPLRLPRALSSFGAARTDTHLYVQGGHIGRAHAHSREHCVPDFHRIPLAAFAEAADPDALRWERLPDGAAVQGTALVAHGDVLYRVGGLSARNAPDEPEDLHSLASVSRFDPATGHWQDLTPLPEGRSSHDAFVVGDTLYVVGGWCLAGPDADEVWHETAWSADLGADPLDWRSLPRPPFAQRALAVTRFGDGVAALGGMDDYVMVSDACHRFDAVRNTWSSLPAFPDMPFGMAAVGVGRGAEARILACGFDGVVRSLGLDARSWDVVAVLATPRFFHRLVPLDDGRVLALGGAGRGGHLRSIEVFRPAAAPSAAGQGAGD